MRQVGSRIATFLHPPVCNDDWYFALPRHENETKNKWEFDSIRFPKFEYVWIPEGKVQTIQIDLQTDCSKQSLDGRFAEPLGFCLPGLEEYFRSVLLQTPWPGTLLRLDLRYATEGVNVWNSGEFLVSEGQRIL